jgi:hypothetical protein
MGKGRDVFQRKSELIAVPDNDLAPLHRGVPNFGASLRR